MGKQVVEMATDKESDSIVKSAPSGNTNDSNEEEEEPTIEKLSLDQDTTDKRFGTQKTLTKKTSPESKSANGVSRSNHTVPQPFALATEKRASVGNRAFVAEVTASNGDKIASVNSSQSKNMIKKAQGTPHFTTRKSLPSDNASHPDDDDSCSATSTTPSVRANVSRTTVATAPTFRCNERAEKRKEFYSKLEEKHQALEAERLQHEARTREEQEAALKELRKNMVFKANPVPSFYQEGPPPKVELKKVPPTRAKSPKLGRRKSFGDANTADNPGGVCTRLHRHSLGGCKDPTNKLQNSPKTGNAIKVRVSKSFRDSPKSLADKPTGKETTGSLTVQT